MFIIQQKLLIFIRYSKFNTIKVKSINSTLGIQRIIEYRIEGKYKFLKKNNFILLLKIKFDNIRTFTYCIVKN